jgi:hypothetical protein
MSRGRWRQRGPGFTDRGLQIRCLSDDQRGVVSFLFNRKKPYSSNCFRASDYK